MTAVYWGATDALALVGRSVRHSFRSIDRKKIRPRRDDIAGRLPQPVSGHQSAPEKRTMIHAGDRLRTPITGEALVVAAARRTRPRGTDGKALGYREIVPVWQQ
jgi:hypothetical protein